MPEAPEEHSQRSTNELDPQSCIAVDWSGAIASVRSRLWLAEAREQRLERVECDFTRDELVDELIASAKRDPRLVVGLDFSFSLPNWFLEHSGVATARELWDLVAREGERWLEECPPPFWGKPSVPRPAPIEGRSEWRATESERVLVGGIGPKSTFQVGGAGTVGTGSLRGMPYLAKLQDAGFAIWPFDAARLPLVIEIYPRYLTGAVDKSNPVARALYVEARLADQPTLMRALAASCEDAFDAAVSALTMQRFSRDFERLRSARRSPLDRREGRIWVPLRDPLFERWLEPIDTKPRGPTRASRPS